MNLTLDIPDELSEKLREQAAREGKSIDEVAIRALKDAVGLAPRVKRRDLSDLAGTWVDDPVFEQVRADHEKIFDEEYR